jgi:hypothetical protein
MLQRSGIHCATSESWTNSACARLCGMIVDANDGMAQQIAENRTDLLDHCTKKELEQADDLGLTLPFLAVYYDRPDMLYYLHKRGLDLSKPCDPMEFGNPMFYAICLKKHRLIAVLDMIGCSAHKECDSLHQNPLIHCDRIQDIEAKMIIRRCEGKEVRAAELFKKNFLKSKFRKLYLYKKECAIKIQKIARGLLAKINVEGIRNTELSKIKGKQKKKRIKA